MATVLLSCSPRLNGNCDMLTRWAQEEIANATVVALRDYKFYPCDGCDACAGGTCKHVDDAAKIHQTMRSADAIVWIAPVYFSGFDAHTKALIDRTQPFFHTAFKTELIPMLLAAVGGQKFEDNVEGMRITLKNFGAVFGAKLVQTEFFFADKKGEVDTSANRSRWQRILRDSAVFRRSDL